MLAPRTSDRRAKSAFGDLADTSLASQACLKEMLIQQQDAKLQEQQASNARLVKELNELKLTAEQEGIQRQQEVL
jgi:hypothetical protein